MNKISFSFALVYSREWTFWGTGVKALPAIFPCMIAGEDKPVSTMYRVRICHTDDVINALPSTLRIRNVHWIKLN